MLPVFTVMDTIRTKLLCWWVFFQYILSYGIECSLVAHLKFYVAQMQDSGNGGVHTEPLLLVKSNAGQPAVHASKIRRVIQHGVLQAPVFSLVRRESVRARRLAAKILGAAARQVAESVRRRQMEPGAQRRVRAGAQLIEDVIVALLFALTGRGGGGNDMLFQIYR